MQQDTACLSVPAAGRGNCVRSVISRKGKVLDKMKIAVKKSPMDVILRDIDLRDIDKHEILLKVKSCGVCGGDLNSSEEYKPFGHEMAGIVEKTGDSVTGIKAGDTVSYNFV